MSRKRTMALTVCAECSKTFNARTDYIKAGRARFCSRRCSGIHSIRGNERRGSDSPRWVGDGIAAARRAVRLTTKKAIRSGKLKPRPCEVCGSTEKLNAHHDDYVKPLEVRWLCDPCHRIYHGAKKVDPRIAGQRRIIDVLPNIEVRDGQRQLTLF